MLVTWLAIFLVVPLAGYELKMWVLILSASVGSLFAGLLVMLGETVIENLILLIVVLVASGVVWGHNPGLGFIFISALLSGVVGLITNQVNQYVADRVLKSGTRPGNEP